MSTVLWHDLECGAYREDLPLWHKLAATHGGPILDLGAGTGRVALELAEAGHEVTALDHDPELVGELRQRAAELPVQPVLADARSFDLPRRFGLCLIPMQTIQLLEGPQGRLDCLRCVARHLLPGGVVAVALAEALEPFAAGSEALLPPADRCERDGVCFASQPVAVHAEREGFTLERRRVVVDGEGTRSESVDRIHLDALSAMELEREAVRAGLWPAGRRAVAPTTEHAGSTVVVLGA